MEESYSKYRKRPHRKNFSRFRAKVKRYSKNGRFGRGTHLEDTDFNYFINILDSMKDGFDDFEEKETMARNVLEQTKDKEIHFASNQIVSKVLEALIGFSNDSALERFFTVFGDNLRPICSDPFSSHVLQKIIEIAFLRNVGKEGVKSMEEETEICKKPEKQEKLDMLEERTYNLETDFKLEHRQKCSGFVERVGKFLLNNLEDFVWDACANHIIRTAILSLAGIHVPKVAFEKNNTEVAKNRKLFVVAPQWHEIVKEYAQRLEMWPQFLDLPYEEQPSALLGVICTALHEVDKKILKHFGKRLLNESFLKVEIAEDEKKEAKEISEESEEKETTTTTNLPKVFQSQSATILLETLLSVAGPKVFTQIYAMLFTGRIEKLAQDRATNFAVQKLLNHMREKPDFEQVFDELCPYVENILKIGNTGVVFAMSAACLRLATKQAAMVTTLQKALNVAGDQERMKFFIICLVKLKPYEIAREDTSTFVHLHGSLIVQHVLQFNKPILIVNCILETPPDKLCAIFNTPNGSHIINAFLESKFIGEKSREKLIRHLENFYVDLAITKFGSRVVECLFVASQEAQRIRIVKGLSEKENLLTSTPFGRLLNTKFLVRTYRRSPAQWKECFHQTKDEKVKDLFKDIIN